jgi:hypothetical protein
MPFQAVPGVYEAVLVGSDDGQLINNTLYFQREGAPSFGEAATLAETVASWYIENVLPHLSNQYTFTHVVVTDLENLAGVQAQSAAGDNAGGEASEQAPNNVAACIKLGTAIRGRSFRGRNYIPGIPNSLLVQNTLSPEWLSIVEIAYQALLGLADPLTWVIVSRETAGATRPTGVATPVVYARFVRNTVDSQRRRLPGRGA